MNRILGAYEAEVAPKFADEPTEVAEKRAMEIGFGVILRQTEKLEAVFVLELVNSARMNL